MKGDNYSQELVVASHQNVKEKEYWLNQLAGSPGKSYFPYDTRETGAKERSLDVLDFRLHGETFSKLMALCKASDHLLHMIMISAVAALLHRYTGNRDILVGTPIYKQDFEGEFINTVLLIRNRLTDNMTFKELLFQVKQTVVEAAENQNYPVEILMDRLNMPLTQNGNPLFDSVVLVENIHDKKYIQNISVNMVFSFSRTRDQVTGTIEYNASLYEKDTVELIAEHFKQLLEAVLFDLDTKVSGIHILSREEKNRILYEFNKTDMPYPNNRTIHELFEEQAAKTPHGTGIVYGERHLTYDKLNKQANRLAHLLRKKGVKAGHVVGIMVERSLEMVIGMLGILKAGGAYLPIDPFSPKKRILLMLEECRVSILVTLENIVEEHPFTALQGLQEIKKIPYVTAKRRQIMDLDQMPVPDRSMVDYEIYNKKIGQAMFKNSLSLQASRGCPYYCLYCHKIWPKKHVFRSAENIFEEVLMYYKLGVRRFAFIDDIFNLNKKNSTRFFQLIVQNKLDVQLAFPNGVRGDILTKDYIDLMVEAGTTIIAFALETASPRLQTLLEKNLNLDKFRENIEYYCEKYPQVILELFTMHGFPSETEEEALMTLDFINSLKWLHFPYIFILKIFPNTDMARFALQQGISYEQIARSDDLFYNELPDTLPFEKSFTLKYQSDFFNNYFLSKKRLLHVLPHQMNLLSEDEIVQAYNLYLPTDVYSFTDLFDALGITKEEVGSKTCRDDSILHVENLREKMGAYFPSQEPGKNALRVLLLDLTQFFSADRDLFYDVIEPPLGLMYLMTYLKRQWGRKVNGKIAKSRIDFDNYDELKRLLEDFNPGVIGIRALTSFKDFFHQTVAMIRHWGIDVPIVAGGPYATSSFQTILQDRNVDLVVLGEGELTFNEVIEKIIENDGKLPDEGILKEIDGIAFIRGESGAGKTCREIIILDELAGPVSENASGNPPHVTDSQNLAYTIFTSGSTGLPKGVSITHANISPLLHWGYKNLGLSPKERVVQNLSYFFDWSAWEIFLALTSGASLYIPRSQILSDAGAYIDFMEKNAITVLHITPTQLQLLMAFEQKLGTLKYLCIGAEKLGGELLERSYRAVDGNCRIFNMYGPTEATIIAAILEIYGPDREKYQCFSSVPIGKPVANAGLLVLDEDLKICPINVRGELYIAGDCLAKGYLNEPGKTAEKFIKNEFPEIAGERLYRTGDIVRWLADGTLEFAGRMDHQVKIRGFRIELGEIENRLIAHPDIKDAVVTVTEGKGGNKILCAYFVPVETGGYGGAGAMELKTYLSKELPDYMIPTHFMPLGRFPLSPNGKVDRKALPAPEIRRETGYIAPGNSIENQLAETWSEVLGIDKDIISITDSFFEFGGNSLKAMELAARIHKKLDTKIPLENMFETPTIQGLAKYVKGAADDRFVSIMPVEEKEYYELSFAQKRMYILQQMDLNSTAYNMPEIIPWPGEVDSDRLEGTFKRLIKRHDSLRTSFHMTGDQPLQKVHGEITFEIEKLDEDRARQFVRSFDLSCAPLLRVGQLKTAGDRNYLLVDMHHIISDGVSHRVLRDDFTALYDGKELPPLRIQYKDFAHWQHGPKEVERLHRQMLYWLKEFEGETPPLEIPLDFPRPMIQSFEGDTIDLEISTGETRALNAAAKAEGSTLFMLLLALFNILLSKLGGREDITVGTPVAGRRHADLEKIIGMFVNTLAVRNYPGGELAFREFLRQVREKSLAVFENQEYPFEDLVDRVSVNRDAGRNPLFDVMFVLENFDRASGGEYKDEPGNKTVPDFDGIGNIPRTSKFDMTLTAVDRGPDRGLFFTVQYCKKLFKRETVERFGGYFKKIVSIIIEDPGRKLKEIEIISDEEKQRLLFDFNDTGTGYPVEKTIHRLFAEQVEKTPDTIAVVGEKDGFPLDVTYRELNGRSGRFARYLRLQGVGIGEMVGIMANRSVDMIAGILGILAAGGAYVPLDPKAPASRINHILSECAVKVLLTPGRFVDEKDASIFEKRNCIPIDRDSQYADMPGGPPAAAGTAANLAYVIFTSGSTGKPKGVPVTHGNLSPLLHWGYKNLGINSKDRAIQNLSYYFDWSVWEIFITLTTGAGLHMVHEDVLLDPGACISYIDTHGITVLHVTPTQYRYLVNVNRVPGSLAYLFIGAEKLSRELAKRSFQSVGPRCRVFNMYGPTECTIIAAVSELDRSPDKAYGNLSSIPIGRPVGNTCLLILDRYLKLCPVNTAGELYIGGDGAAAGYLNSPELTAERFNRSYKSYKTYIFYKTGDLARWLPDGNVEFLGRTDHQVKIRGFRIEPGEIESRIQGYAGIKEVVVLAREDSKAEKYLCAYLVSDVEPVIPELRDYLSKELPGYMIPSHFVPLEKIPLNPNGKIDLKGLPEPGLDGGESYVPPRDEIERKLVDLWSRILRRDALHASPLHASPLQPSIGIDDDFFRLGGHSLNATVLVSKIHKEFNVSVPLVEIFRTPTVKGLGEYIRGNLNEDKYAAILPVEKREYYALSPAQKRLYILQQMEPWNTVYNIPQFFPLSGDISGSVLEEVFAGLIRRHESLRTSFHMVENEPVQRVHDAGPGPSAIDVSIEYFHPDETVKDFIRPFDLSRAPLLRVGVVRTGAGGNENLLLTDIHHIVSDGTSNRVLTDDFTRLLKGDDLPPLRIQYKDFSCWQNSETEREKRAAQGAYWLRGFEGEVPVLNIPVDFVRPSVQVFDGDSVRFRVPGEIAADLKALALGEGATLYMVLLSISTILLSRLGAQEDIVVGTPVAGRRHADLEKIIGMFVNTLALRNYPGGEKTFKAYLGEVRDRTLEAFENQEYPFEDLVEKAAVKRDAGRNPLFDVMFTLDVEDERPVSGDTGGVPGAVEPVVMEEKEVSKFDLTLGGTDTAEGLFFAFQYCTKLFKRESVERFAVYFKNIASSVCGDSNVRLCEIDFLPLEERRRLLYEFNDTGEAYPTGKTLHGLFEEQVERTPGNIAVMDKGTPVTYRELNGQANLIAGHLLETGVGKNEWVGLLVDRSAGMIAGIIGILKAGCGYVPLNTKAPAARSRYILDECRVKRLVTNLADRPGELSENRSVIDLGNIPGESPRGALALSNRVPVSSDLAYVIFTSGSTGKPKGVPMPHSTVSTLLHWGYRDLGMGPGDRVFQNLSYYFDWSVWEIFFTLTTGARFYIVPEEMSANPASSVSFIAENRISVLYATPSQFSYLLGASGQWSSLRYLFLGAETLSVELLKRTFESVSEECRVFNLYGPTETAITSSGFEIPRDGGSYKRYEGLSGVPIGVPVANTDILILDRYLRLSPVNVPGELYIGGDGLSAGYLNDPEKSGASFIKNIYRGAGIKGDRLYRTGDLARWLDDPAARGSHAIEFLGRIDFQVKIRGQRIELGEIESRLLTHELIKEAVVTVRGSGEDKYLCTYYVCAEGKDGEFPGTSELREYLSKELPDYMIPGYFTRLERIPLSPTGKVDRKALPDPVNTAVSRYVAPRDSIEEKLADTWSEILGADNIGIDDDFFEVGGHSLKATILTTRIKNEFGVTLPLIEVFKAPTIRAMAGYIKSSRIEPRTEIGDNLVLLNKKSGDAHNIFFIHDGSGEVEGYVEFCRHLAPARDFNLWGIRADKVENYAPRNITIEETAENYIEKIKTIQDRGPYFIAGWSIGGTIAFEMANQLERAGEKIGFLSLIDSPPPRVEPGKDVPAFTVETERKFVEKYLPDIELKEKLGNVEDIENIWPLIVDYLESNHYDTETVKRVIEEYEAHNVPDYSELHVAGLIEYLNTGRTLYQARALYVPRGKIKTPVHYFAAAQSNGIIKERWNEYCERPVRCSEIDGDHFSIFKMPKAAGFAEVFCKTIDNLV